jgi:hypothetical protein
MEGEDRFYGLLPAEEYEEVGPYRALGEKSILDATAIARAERRWREDIKKLEPFRRACRESRMLTAEDFAFTINAGIC